MSVCAEKSKGWKKSTHEGKKKVTRVPFGAVMLLGLNMNWAFGETSTCIQKVQKPSESSDKPHDQGLTHIDLTGRAGRSGRCRVCRCAS